MCKVLAHIVTYNSSETVIRAAQSILDQELVNGTLALRITDNASAQSMVPVLRKEFSNRIDLRQNDRNLGFSGAHNQAATTVLHEDYDYLLIVNPDLRLAPQAVQQLMNAIESGKDIGTACPLLYRADESLCECEPRMIDAAGMYMTPQLRHFDRGSGEPDQEHFHKGCFVFGGSGACLLLKKKFISDVCLARREDESILDTIAPGLSRDAHQRVQLFDEAFLAYREDADLAWRAQRLGWRCRFAPEAVGYHTRHVLPERRAQLGPELNRLGVRNRFLMQMNNCSWDCGLRSLLLGVVWRNLLVILGVLLKEQSSLPGLIDAVRLLRRAYGNRQYPARAERQQKIRRWFAAVPYVEHV